MTAEPEPHTAELTDDDVEDAPRPDTGPPRTWSRRLTTFAVACGLVIGAAALTLEVEEQRGRDQRSLIVAEQERLQRVESILTADDAISRTSTTEDGARVTSVFSPEQHAAVVKYADLPDIDPKQTYQIWRVRNEQPRSMHVLAADARDGTAVILDLNNGDAISFTVEPEGGSGQPTGDIVVALRLN